MLARPGHLRAQLRDVPGAVTVDVLLVLPGARLVWHVDPGDGDSAVTRALRTSNSPRYSAVQELCWKKSWTWP